MNLTRFAIENRVIVLAVTLVVLLYGTVTFLTMPRREDPELLIRAAVVVTNWPGASAAKIEELVTDPLEKAIDQLDEVDQITSQSRTGMSIITVELDERLNQIEQSWDEVRNKVTQARNKLPEGCQDPIVNTDFGDVGAVIYALSQKPGPDGARPSRPYTWRELERFAERVQDKFKTNSMVARVDIEGIQEEVIYIDVDAEWNKLTLTANDLRDILQRRNITAAGGQIDRNGTRFTVEPTGEFSSVEQIGKVLAGRLDDELPVRLEQLPLSGSIKADAGDSRFRIRRAYADPPSESFRLITPDHDARCLLLSVVMKSGSNIVAMGTALEQQVAELASASLPPDLELVRINDLPTQVDHLVTDFVTNLWQAILIVLVVALLMMGWRPAVIMATAIPLCMIASILVVSLLGVELEQFSIASLIIALGLLVDNAIVVSDNVLREMNRADADPDRRKPAIRGAWSLAVPILTSTATTVGAFLPMLTIVGSVGEYTRSLPIVVATTLIISYLVAMMITPILCFWLLRPTLHNGVARPSLLQRLWHILTQFARRKPKPSEAAPRRSGYEQAVSWCLNNRLITIAAAVLLVIGALSLVPSIGNQFFPGGVRNQFFVHVWLPEGSTLAATDAKCRSVERILQATSRTTIDGEPVDRLRNAVSFVGTGGPRINLTTNPQQSFPNYGFVLVNTTDAQLSRSWAEQVKQRTDQIPGARIDVVPFMLGPYVENPVEFRLYGTDDRLLRDLAAKTLEQFRATPGAVNPFSNWYNDSYGVQIDVDEDAANLAGVSNGTIADTMATLISGGHLTTYREGDHLVRVVLRMRPELRTALLDDPDLLFVDGRSGKVPLTTIAEVKTTWQPGVIARRANTRCVTIGSKVERGYLANDVAAGVRERLRDLESDLPPGYHFEEGGEKEQTTESQDKLSAAFLLSFALILLVLIAQYNSLLKPMIILATVPLALVGALLGLFLSGWALGFMPSLGIISLAGVVINNAIILVDFIESKVRSGMPLSEAIPQAGSERLQPIVLTTLTTVGGLLPLALFGGPMWAGMSWAMIVGLGVSTMLTLLVVPTLYSLFASRFRTPATLATD